MNGRALVFFLLWLLSFSLSAQHICKDDDIDSVMMTIPLKGMDGVDVINVLVGYTYAVTMEHRMEHANRIIHYIDSIMVDMDEDARIVGQYLKGCIYSDVMDLRPQAMSAQLEGVERARKAGNEFMIEQCLMQLGFNSLRVGNYNEAFRVGHLVFTHHKKMDSATIRPYRIANFWCVVCLNINIGEAHTSNHDLDSAMHYLLKAEKIANTVDKMNIPGSRARVWLSLARRGIGAVYVARGLYDKALPLEVSSLKTAIVDHDLRLTTEVALDLAELHTGAGRLKDAEHYLDTVRILLRSTPHLFEMQQARLQKAEAALESAKGNYQYAFDLLKHYSKAMKVVRKNQQAGNVTSLMASYDYNQNQREILKLKEENEINEARIKFQWTVFGAVTLVFVMVAILAITFIRNYRRQKKTNQAIEETQHQIVQSEKMATLGKLTRDLLQQIDHPVQAIQSDVEDLKHNLAVLRKIMNEQEKATPENFREQFQTIQTLKKELEFNDTWDDVDNLVTSIRKEATGTASIVSTLSRSLAKSKRG